MTRYLVDLTAVLHYRVPVDAPDENTAIDAAHAHALTLVPKHAQADIETEAVTNETTGETTCYDPDHPALAKLKRKADRTKEQSR